MPTYILVDEIGTILAHADWPFPDSVQVDFDVVRGWDGKLYKAGEEPAPAPALAEVQIAKRAEINAGFEAALIASLTMPSVNPSAVEVAVGAAALAAVDPDGPAYIMQTHTARRTALLAAVDAATTVEAVQGIAVTYAV